MLGPFISASVRSSSGAPYLNSPDRVPPEAMLAFFSALLDAPYLEHLRSQYTRFRAALATPAGARRLAQCLAGGSSRQRNPP